MAGEGVDWQDHDKVLTEWSNGLQTFYLKTNRNTGKVDAGPGEIIKFPLNNAFPRLVQHVLDKLRVMTNENAQIASSSVAQVRTDFEQWKSRLAHYEEEQKAAMARSPEQADDRYQEQVVFPLLMGVWPDGQITASDAITLVSLIFQAQVARQSDIEALWGLLDDLQKNAWKTITTGTGIIGVVLVLAVLGGAIAYGISQGKK